MNEWTERPAEIARLLNPAFCGAVLREFVLSSSGPGPVEIPFSLLFLVLPIILHRETRELLPRSAATKMHSWLENHPHVRVQFSTRASELVPFVKESLMWLLQRNLIAIGDLGGVIPGSGKLKRGLYQDILQQNREFLKAARLIGHWFRETGAESTIFVMWGISL